VYNLILKSLFAIWSFVKCFKYISVSRSLLDDGTRDSHNLLFKLQAYSLIPYLTNRSMKLIFDVSILYISLTLLCRTSESSAPRGPAHLVRNLCEFGVFRQDSDRIIRPRTILQVLYRLGI